MHWSSTLQRRFIPPDAMIIADLRCPGCGYALRGLSAIGRCPECGRAVLDSIRPIPDPAGLAKSLGETGWAFVTLIVVVVTSVLFGPIAAGIGILLLIVLAAFRGFAVAGLRRPLRQVSIAGVDQATTRLLVSVVLETGPLGVLLLVTIMHVATAPPGWMTVVLQATPLMLLAVALAQVALLADLARRIALWLELERMERESKIALGLLAGGTLGLLLGAAAGVGLTQARDTLGMFSLLALLAAIVMAARAFWRGAAAIPRLDQSPAELIDRPLMSVSELKERGLLAGPRSSRPN